MKRLATFILTLMLCISVVSPAYATDEISRTTNAALDTMTVSNGAEYDFSSQDAIDKYDQYEKRDKSDGTTYVHMFLHNSFASVNPLPADYYRYGAFLRDSSEVQCFSFFNLPYNYTTTSQNVLTIYADPEVKFEVRDWNDILIADNISKHADKVVHYKKSTDNGHSVYYIEFAQDSMDNSRHYVYFSTNSTTTQPHYSLWFGAALMQKANASVGSIALSVTAKRASSNIYMLSGPSYLPQRAWISKVYVTNVRTSNADKISSASFGLTAPVATKTTCSTSFRKNLSRYEFDLLPNFSSVYPVKGIYKFYLSPVRWNTGVSSGTVTFSGNVSIEYIYSFGA